MAINFNSLPSEKPNALPEAGTYIGVIETAEMVANKSDSTKPDYLNLKMNLFDPLTKEKKGTIYDIITESNTDLAMYKLKRFIVALGIPITGTFELKSLTKVCINKRFLVDIAIQKDKTGTYPDKAVVDVFKGEIYTAYVEAEHEIPFTSAPINAPDAADATETTTEY